MSVRTPQWLRPPHLSLAIAATTALAMAAIVEARPFRNPLRQRTTVERLAEKIDQVEKVLDTYGTVVAKSPDVWGEARLTKYRRDVEDVLSDQLTKFQPTLSATITRSDQAFLASSLALQAALGGRRAAIVSPTDRVESEVTESVATTSDGTIQLAPDGKPIIVKKSTPRVIADETTTDQQIPGGPSEPSAMTATFAKRAQLLTSTGAGGFANGNAVGIEPTVMLDQLTRYLDHLNQLRRTNDGDDLSDSPGYALHLVRIPVSVLPGKCTKEGYGAEVTITAKAHLHDKLLPQTFKSLVLNDLVDQLSFPLAKLIDSKSASETISALLAHDRKLDRLRSLQQTIKDLQAKLDTLKTNRENLLADQKRQMAEKANLEVMLKKSDGLVDGAKQSLTKAVEAREKAAKRIVSILPESELKRARDKFSVENLSAEQVVLPDFRNLLKDDEKKKVDELYPDFQKDNENYTSSHESYESLLESRNKVNDRVNQISKQLESTLSQLGDITKRLEAEDEERVSLELELQSATSNVNAVERAVASIEVSPAASISPSRRAQFPFPPEKVLDVYGHDCFGVMGKLVSRLKSDEHNKRAALLLDVQKVLSECVNGAFRLCTQDALLWQHCTPELASLIRLGRFDLVKERRIAFMESLPNAYFEDVTIDGERIQNPSTTIALVWAIIVESALLNEGLIEDMRLMQTAKNCHCISTDWMEFFRPEPAPEAVMAFNQYVECRWPVHVFAIDPETDDQNVLDSFSQRREMQLALSLAFASGKIGAQQFMRFARTMDLDMQTIALNRTAVGFSHGDDTFGWRFYPRVQSPPSRGNLAVVTREMLIGGYTQDQQLCTRRLEPGMRECTAIVLMPAFVPYAIFDLRTNWFKLTNPAKKELDLRDGVGISADIVALRQLSQACVQDAALYRDSDVYQLTRAVDQLERRLPMQTTYVQLPFENSLGGFEFFNGGAPDLAPELHGFYGEPGISAKDGVESTIFLVGDNFSVHETNVIVGNQAIQKEKMRLISRQVLQVTAKAPVGVVEDKVDIHVATPYGVTNHLLVPLIDAPKEAAAKALADHEENRHVDRFSWKDALTPTLIVDIENGDILHPELAQADAGAMVRVTSTGTSKSLKFDDNERLTAKMAAQLIIKSSDSAKAPETHPVGAWSVEIGKDLALKSLVDKFPMALSKVPNGFDPKEIEFVGFLRFPAANNMPTLRLENKLVFRVVKSDETNDASSAPPPAAGILPPGELLPPAPDPAEARRLQRLPLPLSP